MIHRYSKLVALALIGLTNSVWASELSNGRLDVEPTNLTLYGTESSAGVLVTSTDVDGLNRDLTRSVQYDSLTPDVFSVDDGGIIRAKANGTGQLKVTFQGRTRFASVTVADAETSPKYSFQSDVIPILSKYGCNSSGCHGKAEGQNGFKLSVFGFDTQADFQSLTAEGRGRRVFVAAPNQSLLLTKACGAVPHGGGERFQLGSRAYEIVRRWIANGARLREDAPRLKNIRILPSDRILAYESKQQLRVVAEFDDGRQKDVTWLANFQSNNDAIAEIDDTGLVTVGQVPGHAAVMASFLEKVALVQILVPHEAAREVEIAKPKASKKADDSIDRIVDSRLKDLNIIASDRADDATFLRRVYIDTIGTLPTAVEAQRFLTDPNLSKREQVINDLLNRPEYDTYWALKWSDLLRVDRQLLGRKAAFAYYRWIKQNIESNTPFDKLARSIVSTHGNLRTNPAANFFKAVKEPGERASVLSQVFLGIRISCAECHHHPFDRWSQNDFHGMVAFFRPTELKSTSRGEFLIDSGRPVATHPRTHQEVMAHALLGDPIKNEDKARLEFANWLTDPKNPWFAKNIANRYWAHFLGRGIIEPVDDIRSTNPPTNPELLDALATSFIESGYDVKELIRTIVSSAAYQRGTTPNSTNARDEQNYSRAPFKNMDAEVLMDAVSQVTGIDEKFQGIPAETRAIELWDSGSPHYFLNLFGRPLRKTACECERNSEPNVAQVLHMLNSPEIHDKLTHANGTVARLIRTVNDDDALATQLYLTYYSRFPTSLEKARVVEILGRDGTPRLQAAEDIAWSMLNSYEFLFNH